MSDSLPYLQKCSFLNYNTEDESEASHYKEKNNTNLSSVGFVMVSEVNKTKILENGISMFSIYFPQGRRIEEIT